MNTSWSGAEIRQMFIDFFAEHGHTYVPSSSLVPGGDQTLLFTNAGMVQFKDVFLGTDHRPYKRAANSQKCMRVAGKHNDLDDVGRDDTHHTFFEMLGNWSFGDYYKQEAITWAWQLLTDVWGLHRSALWVTCFMDEKGEIPTDEEAAISWRQQPGMNPEHILFFGRKDNFWEMADTGPCGPCSEIHLDRGVEYCDKQAIPGHTCSVNGDCKRFLELWNLVFIQYNRLSPTKLEPLPAKHVDTGMGFERIVSVLQNKNSNYRTDLLLPLMEKVREMTGHSEAERDANITPYRVIADHARAASFLIADGVVPGNTGRNYVCRMIIRRASRFGAKIGLHQPFLAKVAEVVVNEYGNAYPELMRNRDAILDNLTREEKRFQRTVEQGLTHLQELLDEVILQGGMVLDGGKAFDLYATHGLPVELVRDVAREQGLEVDQTGFAQAMEEHRIASGAGKTFGALGGEQVDVYRPILETLQTSGGLGAEGVIYDPYSSLEIEGNVLALVRDGAAVSEVMLGDEVEVILPATCFYIESGGQVSDTGTIVSVNEPRWEIRVEDTRKPAAGIIVHVGEVIRGKPNVGDAAIAAVDAQRRRDIMRNHTATHLLHAELQAVLGKHARQAGSLVAPDRLRFDFTHPEAISAEQLERIEAGVNQAIFEDFRLKIRFKPLAEAIEEGAMALFGEKYAETVRTITIGDADTLSYELCGGTHVENTGDIGVFLIISEGSAAAGIRRIEAVTGREAYALIQRRFRTLKQAAQVFSSAVDDLPHKAAGLLEHFSDIQKNNDRLREQLVAVEFEQALARVKMVSDVHVMTALLTNANADTLRAMTDRFRQKYSRGLVVLASVENEKPVIVAAISDDLVKDGWHAGELIKPVASVVGGGGGGRPNLAQAGGKHPARINEGLDQVIPWVISKTKG
ncbi:MAG: alanine--tRNA ligase [Bellilinea sp.]|jgi:alanyl-tRNA synthetase